MVTDASEVKSRTCLVFSLTDSICHSQATAQYGAVPEGSDSASSSDWEAQRTDVNAWGGKERLDSTGLSV